MSFQMELQMKVKQQLVEAVLDFVDRPKEAKAQPSLVLTEAIKAAFKLGGLDEVDRLIESINDSIKERGGKAGLGEGAALQASAPLGKPLYLHIYFASFEFDNVIARQAILLEFEDATATPD